MNDVAKAFYWLGVAVRVRPTGGVQLGAIAKTGTPLSRSPGIEGKRFGRQHGTRAWKERNRRSLGLLSARPKELKKGLIARIEALLKKEKADVETVDTGVTPEGVGSSDQSAGERKPAV